MRHSPTSLLVLLCLVIAAACSDDDGSDVAPNVPPTAGAGGAGAGGTAALDAGPGGSASGGSAGASGPDAGAGAAPGCTEVGPDAGGADAGGADAGALDAGLLDGGGADASAGADDRVSFAADLRPLFEERCGPCHTETGYGGHNVGGELQQAYADAVRLGQTLVARIDGGGMPPPNALPPNDCGSEGGGQPGDPGCLTEAEVALVQAWIDQCYPP